MPKINASAWEQIAHAIFGIQGENPIPDLEYALRAAVVLRSDRPEWGFPAGEMLCAGQILVGGVASERTWSALRNPADSGVLVVVEDFTLDNGTNTEHTFAVLSPAVAKPVADSVVTGFVRDSRWEPTIVAAIPACRIAGGSQGANPAVNTQWSYNPSTGAGAQRRLRGALAILGPGADAMMTNQGIASSLRISWIWKEIPLHKGVRA